MLKRVPVESKESTKYSKGSHATEVGKIEKPKKLYPRLDLSTVDGTIWGTTTDNANEMLRE
ncbi:hypothetical protein NHQ30_009195 [Ciborinia camelliae]|nr:hypothetical protein NHQ30_009195 [Ciborinia camelliae]